jgi:CysZ protein
MFSYLTGLNDCFSGFGLIFKSGIRKFVAIPLLINIGLFSAAIYIISQQIDSWLESLLPSWLSWLTWLIWPLFFVTVLLVVFYSFTLVANLIAAPFNSLLAARVEMHITGKRPIDINAEKIFSLAFARLALRSINSELHKMLYFLLWLIPLVAITFTPIINITAPFCWFVYAAWSFTLEYTDYPLANRGMLFSEVRQYNRDNRMRTLGLGTGIFIITSIPLINFLAMPVAIAGATALTTKTQER